MSVGELDPVVGELDVPVRIDRTPTPGDRVFRGLALGAGLLSFLIIGLALIFLVKESWPAISANRLRFFTDSIWSPGTESFGVLGLVTGTVLIAVIALVVAFPLSLASALFINEYAPMRVRSVLTFVIDFMAALPSLIVGLWGFFVLQGPLSDVARWLADNLSVIPLFQKSEAYTQSIFICGVVVAIMILPIITSIVREIFSQAPRDVCEAALALGGTRWAMIRDAILPFGRSGMVGAALLGLGRALGETIAVSLILAVAYEPKLNVLERGGGSIAANIVNRFKESDLADSALLGSGLALFVVTLLVNAAAQRVVKKSRSAA
jgi:phosphate transport system permease protein